MKKELLIKEQKVTISENPGRPLLVLTRRAVHEMGLWDKIWDYLTPYYSLATFSLPVVDIGKFKSSPQLFNYLAGHCVNMAEELGYKKIHLFGWGGGAQLAMRCLVDYSENLYSCILLGANFPDKRDITREKLAVILKTILNTGDLKLYTYYWLLNGFSPEYISEHSAEIKAMVENRIKSDKGRVDTNKVWEWLEIQGQAAASVEELRKVRIPTLIVAPAFDYSSRLNDMKKLQAVMPKSELAIIPDGTSLILYENPQKFMEAAGPFLKKMASAQS